MPASAKDLFAWHERPGAIERLSPLWTPVTVRSSDPGIGVGSRADIRIHLGPLRIPWKAEHIAYQSGVCFTDRQTFGPFAMWRHTHETLSLGPAESWLVDDITYALPGGRLGDLLAGYAIEKNLARMFDYRHRVTARDLSRHLSVPGKPKLRIVITGASGVVGKALVPFLTTGGHTVYTLVRRKPAADHNEIYWHPGTGEIDAAALEGMDAVIHLAGENILQHPWTPAVKKRIVESRTHGTRLLSECLVRLKQPPKVVLSASAIGYYGDRKDAVMTEADASGTGFISHVCQGWESAAKALVDSEIRTVFMRIGVVLTPAGGALARMAPRFRMGLGGRLGSGAQYLSWVSIEDLIGSMHYLLFTDHIHGPVNIVSPHPVTDRTFTKILAHLYKLPAVCHVPEHLIRRLFGEMGEEVVLSSTRVRPKRLMESGYRFTHAFLSDALKEMLGC